MKLSFFSCLLFSAVVCSDLQAAEESHHAVSDEVIAHIKEFMADDHVEAAPSEQAAG